MSYLPAIFSAVGAAKQSQAASYNAGIAQNEANLSINQANAQEGQVRRVGREALGRQSAAFGAAGVGYGGSSETALDQSAVNQEIDALNTRYKGSVTAYGYRTQSNLDESASKGYGLMAGAALLKGIGSNINYGPPSAIAYPGTPGGGT